MPDEDPHDFINRPRTRVRPDSVWDALLKEISEGKVFKRTYLEAFKCGSGTILPKEVADLSAKIAEGKTVFARPGRGSKPEFERNWVNPKWYAARYAARMKERLVARGMTPFHASYSAAERALARHPDLFREGDELVSYIEKGKGWAYYWPK